MNYFEITNRGGLNEEKKTFNSSPFICWTTSVSPNPISITFAEKEFLSWEGIET